MTVLALLLVLVCQSYSPLAGQDQAKVKEPEALNEFFFVDSVGDIRPLERQEPRKLEIIGNRSSIRFVQGEPLAFVVRVSSSQIVDPAALFRLIQLKARGENRVIEYTKGGPKKGVRYANLIPFEATQYGDSSFKVKSKADLGPGEYLIVLSTEKDGFCFAVDGVKTDLR